jgi:hypothetical protein
MEMQSVLVTANRDSSSELLLAETCLARAQNIDETEDRM